MVARPIQVWQFARHACDLQLEAWSRLRRRQGAHRRARMYAERLSSAWRVRAHRCSRRSRECYQCRNARRSRMSRRSESALVVKRCESRHHRRLLISTDFVETRATLPIFDDVDTHTRITVLGTYRIPFCGLHTLLGAPRLERELAARTRESMLAFVESTGLASARFELLVCHGDPNDHIVREARSRGSDLVVLAFTARSCRMQRRTATLLLEQTSCDLWVVEGDRPRPRWFSREALVAVGPWAG